MPEITSASSLSYTKKTLSNIKKQKKLLTNKTKEVVKYIIDKRDELAKYVFKYQNNSNVNIPVHFNRIIENIKNNLRIKSNFFVDITPIELYKQIEDAYENIEL